MEKRLTFLYLILTGLQAGELILIDFGPTFIGLASGNDSITVVESFTVRAASWCLLSVPGTPPRKSEQGSNISLGIPMSARKLKLSVELCWLWNRLS